MTVAFTPSRHAGLGRLTGRALSSRVGFVARLRYQLLGAVLIGVLLPAVIRTGFDVTWKIGSMENTLIATFAAMLVGFVIMHRLTAYPGIWALSFVVPSFVFSYLTTAVVVLLMRVDYARFQFVFSFVLVVAWFYLVVIVERRIRRPRLMLLPFGDASRLANETAAEWVVVAPQAQLDLPLNGNAETAASPNLLASPASLPPGTKGIVADLRANLPLHIEHFLAECALSGVPVYHSKQIQESLSGRVEIEHLSENTLGSVIPSSLYFRIKRAADIAIAILAAPLVLLIGLVAAIAIKLDDGGPVFFRQTRIGHRGEPFTIVKFRSMRTDAAGLSFTRDDDDRITRAGRFLRRYRVDELPQVINILSGEMSWIGPRPEAVPLAAWYQSKIPFYSYRHIVRPGITGWAAVNQGNVAELPAATSKLQYDFFYIKNFSPWLDLLIAVRTLIIMLSGFGSR